MLVLRLLLTFIGIFLIFEVFSVTAVAWSFYESVNTSFSQLKYSSDTKARDILSILARVTETKMTPEGQAEMSEFFNRIIVQSEKDLDKFQITDIFLVSNDGALLSHNSSEELKKLDPSKYNQPMYMRALRMRKGQLPIPQSFGKEFEGEGGFLDKWILKNFPDIKYQTILLSAPIYHTERLEALGTIHMVYSRGNLLFFMKNQKDVLKWIVLNFGLVALISTILTWSVAAYFMIGSYRQGLSTGKGDTVSTTRLGSLLQKQEETLQRMITPMPVKLDSDISLNIMDQDRDLSDTTQYQAQFLYETEQAPSVTVTAEEEKKKAAEKNTSLTEAVDAIPLD